jgi:hypothetical protein
LGEGVLIRGHRGLLSSKIKNMGPWAPTMSYHNMFNDGQAGEKTYLCELS